MDCERCGCGRFYVRKEEDGEYSLVCYREECGQIYRVFAECVGSGNTDVIVELMK